MGVAWSAKTNSYIKQKCLQGSEPAQASTVPQKPADRMCMVCSGTQLPSAAFAFRDAVKLCRQDVDKIIIAENWLQLFNTATIPKPHQHSYFDFT